MCIFNSHRLKDICYSPLDCLFCSALSVSHVAAFSLFGWPFRTFIHIGKRAMCKFRGQNIMKPT